jgi:predicted RNA methylase
LPARVRAGPAVGTREPGSAIQTARCETIGDVTGRQGVTRHREVRVHTVVEIYAGAGGQSLGLELAGFCHELAVELDANACNALRHNRPR